MSATSERIGEYRIVRERARTAAAVTYEAVHAVLPRRAIVKVTSATQHIALRALREAIYLETMDHPGVPRLYESALTQDRRPWFARELIEGPSVETLFERKIRFDSVEPLERLRDIAEVLAHAHQRGVVHASLRPDRILIARRSHNFPLCIADWSDARAHDAAPTPFVAAPGAWHYAAPEVVIGDAIDDRADVFSLGVIAYRMLTGMLPFERGALQAHHEGELHTPSTQLAPEAPREVCAIVDQMLAYDRWDRPSSGEVLKDLAFLIEMLASARLRIRNPRWTPQFEIEHPEALQPQAITEAAVAGITVGEIVAKPTLEIIADEPPPGALEEALLALADGNVEDEYEQLEVSQPIEVIRDPEA